MSKRKSAYDEPSSEESLAKRVKEIGLLWDRLPLPARESLLRQLQDEPRTINALCYASKDALAYCKGSDAFRDLVGARPGEKPQDYVVDAQTWFDVYNYQAQPHVRFVDELIAYAERPDTDNAITLYPQSPKVRWGDWKPVSPILQRWKEHMEEVLIDTNRFQRKQLEDSALYLGFQEFRIGNGDSRIRAQFELDRAQLPHGHSHNPLWSLGVLVTNSDDDLETTLEEESRGLYILKATHYGELTTEWRDFIASLVQRFPPSSSRPSNETIKHMIERLQDQKGVKDTMDVDD